MIDEQKIDQWFRRTQKQFSSIAMEKAGRPIVYVEIGVWGGACSKWVCGNILTHPDSIGFGIDPYDQSQERERWNVAEIKQLAADRMQQALGNRYQWIYRPSSDGLLVLRNALGFLRRKIDILYIDGLHEGADVMTDFVLAWPMLQTGSLVIFDDYVKRKSYYWPHVRHACAAIELAFRHHIQPISIGNQYAIRIVQKELPDYELRRTPQKTIYPNLALPDLYKRNELLG